MIYLDGGAQSGSGTILRYGVSLAGLLGQEIEIVDIRAKRAKPGLRPQHLTSVMACKQMTCGKVEGAEVGSDRIIFRPTSKIMGGDYSWDIGTAGSTTMLAMTILPLAIFADRPSTFRIEGGLFQDQAPSAFHTRDVLFSTLKRMGIEAAFKLIRPGYVPRGGGIIEVKVNPIAGRIKPLKLLDRGRIAELGGIALSSHLKQQDVSERMAQSCSQVLRKRGQRARIETVYETISYQKGAALFLWARTDTGCLIGSDMAGKVGRSSEKIGRYVARTLLEDVDANATVDRYLADQLIIYAALADGVTEYIIPELTDHVRTNLWLVEEILGAKTSIAGSKVRIEGVGYTRRSVPV